eukprot:5358714-Amphidinium_carterae.2
MASCVARPLTLTEDAAYLAPVNPKMASANLSVEKKIHPKVGSPDLQDVTQSRKALIELARKEIVVVALPASTALAFSVWNSVEPQQPPPVFLTQPSLHNPPASEDQLAPAEP